MTAALPELSMPEVAVLPAAPEPFQSGARFILDAPDEVPAIWGDGENVAWAAGEPVGIVGPQGVGKSTMAQRLSLARAGIGEPELLGMPVEVDGRRVLYIAADRPRQIARSFARMVGEADRAALDRQLVICPGAPPFDVARAETGSLAAFVASIPGIGTVVVDSLKDLATGLADDEVGSRVSAELGRVIAEGIELVIVHHERKAKEAGKPPRLDDVYGSTWLTAGMGSVLLVWGEPGDPLVELRTLKHASGEIGPLTVAIDHSLGEVRIDEKPDLAALAAGSIDGITATEAAISLYRIDSPKKADRERARRQLDALVKRGVLERDEAGGITEKVRYRRIDRAGGVP